MKRSLLAAALALAVAIPAALAQEMGKKDEEAERLAQTAEMVKEAKRFLASVKLSAKDAIQKASGKQPGIVVALRAEQQKTKDKAGKEEKLDVFEVLIVKEAKDPNAPKPDTLKEPPKEPPAVFKAQVDADGKVTVLPAADDEAREAQVALKRLTATNATVTIPVVIDKLATHEKASVVSVLLQDREERKDKKTEGWLVYALVGDSIAWYDVDATTGEVEKRK
jgi:hypothetical protein